MEKQLEEAVNYAVSSIRLEDDFAKVNSDLVLESFKTDDLISDNRDLLISHKIAKLCMESSNVAFDANHYLEIHKYLYDGISEEAGLIAKDSNTLKEKLDVVLIKANDNINNITTREDLLSFIVKLYSDLDSIHPFTEGNGRTLREFIREFINYICERNNLDAYYLDYSKVNKYIYIDCMVRADSYMQYDPLYTLFDSILKVKEKEVSLKQA